MCRHMGYGRKGEGYKADPCDGMGDTEASMACQDLSCTTTTATSQAHPGGLVQLWDKTLQLAEGLKFFPFFILQVNILQV